MRIVAEVVDHPSEKLFIQKFRRRKGYRRLAKAQPKTVLIDATKPAEEISALILARVAKVLK